MDDDFRRVYRNAASSRPRGRRSSATMAGLFEFFGSRRRLVAGVFAGLAVAALAVALLSPSPGSSGAASPPAAARTDSSGEHLPTSGEADSLDSTPPPDLEDLGGGRYRGPNGTIVKVPAGWEITEGDQIELWASLVPEGSTAPLPRIGIGDIVAEGLDPHNALETVGYYLSEVLPEITSTEEPFRGGVLVKGGGTVEGTPLEEVRWMHPLEGGVLVVWGLFPPGYPGAVELVVDSVEPPPG